MSEPRNSAGQAADDGTEDRVKTTYGADWVGLDTRSMRARRNLDRRRAIKAVEEEKARRQQEDEQIKELLEHADDDEPKSSSNPPGLEKKHGSPKPRARPKALVERLLIQNLRAFAGPHQIPLAPLTLIYGPNSAGKSTVLKGLKLFRDVVDAGRRDAIDAWHEAFKETSARTLMTYSEPDPDDPSGLQWRSPLVVGVDYRTHDEKIARAELSYGLNPVGSIDVHSTALGVLGEGEPSRKSFVPQDFADDNEPFHPGDFGKALLRTFVVEEDRGDGQPTSEVRVTDGELFAHSDRSLQADLFEMAYLLRYIGPHRGEPGKEYKPESGDFNSSWFDGYRKPRIGGYDEFELLNQMLAQLEIPYVFEQDPLSGLKNQLERKWIMRDVRSGAPVALDQVGYGVSQLLPVVDICVHAQKQLICVEEPELHLHPRLQARLGNLFATAVLSGGNQVIVETHSESILLRVRRLIRGGKLRPEDVAVIYVDNTQGGGATVRRLRLGVQGELLDPWPTGFFDDGLSDILGRLS